MSFEFFISLRYLRAKRKQVFVSIITFLSIGGIALGVAALIIVLAVMNGFETDLRNKILGMNSHILLMEYAGPMKNYDQVAKKVSEIGDVAATTPFIYSQAMLKSPNGVTGVVLRGLAPETAFRVISLGKIREGKTDYLEPAKRVRLSLPGEVAALPGILIGKELAKNLGTYLYDPLTVISPMGISTPMGMIPKMKRFLVVGSSIRDFTNTIPPWPTSPWPMPRSFSICRGWSRVWKSRSTISIRPTPSPPISRKPWDIPTGRETGWK